jgi:hypothetical protein
MKKVNFKFSNGNCRVEMEMPAERLHETCDPAYINDGHSLYELFGVNDGCDLWRECDGDDELISDSSEIYYPIFDGDKLYAFHRKVNGS